jgi:hypothetical protein
LHPERWKKRRAPAGTVVAPPLQQASSRSGSGSVCTEAWPRTEPSELTLQVGSPSLELRRWWWVA